MSTGHDNPELELQIDPEWVDMFSPRILDRGYAYFIDGTVHDIEKSEFGYTAVVEGSRPYHVEVELDDDGTLVDADCDCPYAMDGNWCNIRVWTLVWSAMALSVTWQMICHLIPSCPR